MAVRGNDCAITLGTGSIDIDTAATGANLHSVGLNLCSLRDL